MTLGAVGELGREREIRRRRRKRRRSRRESRTEMCGPGCEDGGSNQD